MLSVLKKIIKIIFFSLATVIIHFVLTSFLPYPYNQINVILIFLILALTIKNREEILWYALLIGFLTESFMAIPFGINTLALTLCIWVTYWFYNNIFVHHSTFLIVFLSALSILFYRLLFFALIISAGIIKNKDIFNLITISTIINLLWEIGFTTVALTVLYGTINYFVKFNKINASSKILFYERIFRE